MSDDCYEYVSELQDALKNVSPEDDDEFLNYIDWKIQGSALSKEQVEGFITNFTTNKRDILENFSNYPDSTEQYTQLLSARYDKNEGLEVKMVELGIPQRKTLFTHDDRLNAILDNYAKKDMKVLGTTTIHKSKQNRLAKGI